MNAIETLRRLAEAPRRDEYLSVIAHNTDWHALLAEVERLQIAIDVIGSLGLGVVYGPDEQPDPTEGEPSAVVYEHEEGHFLLRVPEAAELLHKLIHVRAAEAAANRKDGDQ